MGLWMYGSALVGSLRQLSGLVSGWLAPANYARVKMTDIWQTFGGGGGHGALFFSTTTPRERTLIAPHFGEARSRWSFCRVARQRGELQRPDFGLRGWGPVAKRIGPAAADAFPGPEAQHCSSDGWESARAWHSLTLSLNFPTASPLVFERT